MAGHDRSDYLDGLAVAASEVAVKRESGKGNPHVKLDPEELKIERKWKKEQMTLLEKFKAFRSHDLLCQVLEDIYSKIGGVP